MKLPVFLIAGVLAAALGVFAVVRDEDEPPAEPAAAVPTSECPADYGAPPDGFDYAPADEATRTRTIEALGLNESGGRVDMRLAQQGGITLGNLVGVPAADPAASVASIAGQARSSGAKVRREGRYELITLASGRNVAVGPRGCRAVLITAADPEAVRYLAALVFE